MIFACQEAKLSATRTLAVSMKPGPKRLRRMATSRAT